MKIFIAVLYIFRWNMNLKGNLLQVADQFYKFIIFII